MVLICISKYMEGMAMDNNVIPHDNGLAGFNPGQATLLEMRADSQRFPRVKSVPREQAIYEMSKIVSQAFLYKSQAVDPTNIRFISSALVNELLDDKIYGAAYLSFAEIQVVVKRAVLGGSEMFGLSVASLYKVIMDYAKGEGHRHQMQIAERKRAETRRMQEAVIDPLLQGYTNQFIKNHKTK